MMSWRVRFGMIGFSFLICMLMIDVRRIMSAEEIVHNYLKSYCIECHGAAEQKGGFDLKSLKLDLSSDENFARWVKVYDRIENGAMPPKDIERPPKEETKQFSKSLNKMLIAAEQAASTMLPGTGLRRLTRSEYENTIRDLFDMPGIALAGMLPADGSAHGFDKNSDALDVSHVNVLKYFEAADHVLDYAIATRPTAPTVQKRRISLVNRGGFVAHVVMNGDGVLLKEKISDPMFPPSGEQGHIDQGAHERMGSFKTGSSVGLFRHEDESFSPYFSEHVTIYPGRYRVRTSLWSFQWDRGKVLPSRGTEAARLSVVQLTGDGRGGQHPSYVLGYFDAPSIKSQEHEIITWMNRNEMIGFNTGSLAPVANYNRKGRAMAFTGPGIACDWLDVEGPLNEIWPPAAHTTLFGNLPLIEFKAVEQPGVRAPVRTRYRQLGAGQNRSDLEQGLWTVLSEQPLIDADHLLASFLPKVFRRPVNTAVRKQYVEKVEERIKTGDSFETAMRWAYRAALCSPDFLYHVESNKKGNLKQIDDYAFACRLSYFLWNSLPDQRLTELAQNGKVREPKVLRAEVERLFKDTKSERFIKEFLGQWLKLHKIAATDPDRKLYPEFNSYLQDSMVAETQAYFRELIDKNLNVSHLVQSDFAMLNEKLAVHYGIHGVSGSQIRRVDLPIDCPRGGFLTQASILKITANGTTTSPVPRGAFVMDRLLGRPPDPPPANITAVEPDVLGATTIREQLEKHRNDTSCAACHLNIDPPGFALEAFDVIGGHRNRYRSLGEGDSAERGSIDPFIGITFKMGPVVDPSGVFPGSGEFSDIQGFKRIIANDTNRLLTNLARQLITYSTGRKVAFGDRDAINSITSHTQAVSGGIRTLLHETVQSELFTKQ